MIGYTSESPYHRREGTQVKELFSRIEPDSQKKSLRKFLNLLG